MLGERDDIEIKTESGTILLKHNGSEYRAYMNGEDLKYGAAVPDRLIEFLQKRFAKKY